MERVPVRGKPRARRRARWRAGARAVTRAGGGDTKSTIASHRWSTDMDAWVIEGTDCALEEGERLILRAATSANMGPGFDCFGFAVDVRNELIVERGEFEIDIVGEGKDELPRDETNAIYDAVVTGFEAARPDRAVAEKFAIHEREPHSAGERLGK